MCAEVSYCNVQMKLPSEKRGKLLTLLGCVGCPRDEFKKLTGAPCFRVTWPLSLFSPSLAANLNVG